MLAQQDAVSLPAHASPLARAAIKPLVPQALDGVIILPTNFNVMRRRVGGLGHYGCGASVVKKTAPSSGSATSTPAARSTLSRTLKGRGNPCVSVGRCASK